MPDDAFAAQMAAREQLLDSHRDDVLMLDAEAMPAAQELLGMVLDQLYSRDVGQIQRADGRIVDLD